MHLSLRTNNIPSVLSPLVLPALDTLRLAELDGKAPGRGEQVGVAVNEVLVRMRLGQMRTGGGRGVRVLELVGVDVSVSDLGRGGVWERCFLGMGGLERVGVGGDAGLGVDGVLEVLLGGWAGRLRREKWGEDERCVEDDVDGDEVCPLLKEVRISGSSMFAPAVARFKTKKPGVVVEFESDGSEVGRGVFESGSTFPEAAHAILGGSGHIAGLGGFGFGSGFAAARGKGRLMVEDVAGKGAGKEVAMVGGDEDSW